MILYLYIVITILVHFLYLLWYSNICCKIYFCFREWYNWWGLRSVYLIITHGHPIILWKIRQVGIRTIRSRWCKYNTGAQMCAITCDILLQYIIYYNISKSWLTFECSFGSTGTGRWWTCKCRTAVTSSRARSIWPWPSAICNCTAAFGRRTSLCTAAASSHVTIVLCL